MAGPRLDRRSERGRRFAQELIDAAHAGAVAWQASRLGPTGLRIGWRTDDDFARLVAGAFLPADGRPETLTLAVVRHGELPRLPSTLWAQEWTQTGRPVPPEVTGPYQVFVDRQVGIAYAFDRSSGRAAVWIRSESELDLRSFITPFRVLLSWMAGTFDAEVVHASAAVIDGHAVAFSGASGSGKSTLAVGLGLAGHQLISDDCLLLHDGVAHAVFARAKLDDVAAELVDAGGLELRSLPRTPRAKRYFAVADLGDRFVAAHPLGAWGFPVLGLGTGHYRLSPRRAYRMLAADSLREIFGGGTGNRLRLARAARRDPAYRLLLGPSTRQNAEVVRSAVGGAVDGPVHHATQVGARGA